MYFIFYAPLAGVLMILYFLLKVVVWFVGLFVPKTVMPVYPDRSADPRGDCRHAKR